MAGRRRVGIFDLAPLPCDSLPEYVLLTSLLGAVEDWAFCDVLSMGATEVYEKSRDGESGLRLERGLSLDCDICREESRLYHEPREDMESLRLISKVFSMGVNS